MPIGSDGSSRSHRPTVALLAAAAATVATLSLGRLGIAPSDLVSALTRGATGKQAFVLERLRDPSLDCASRTGKARIDAWSTDPGLPGDCLGEPRRRTPGGSGH